MLKLIYRDWENSLHANFIVEPEMILDCGFGSGNWAYDLAEYDPDCTVRVNPTPEKHKISHKICCCRS
jgi:ubiquinone/menaquinone biosynthesis C-methylase UbiE